MAVGFFLVGFGLFDKIVAMAKFSFGDICRILGGVNFVRGSVIFFNMFGGLIDGIVARAINENAKESEITEVRLRVGRPLVFSTAEGKKYALLPCGQPYIVTKTDVERLVGLASDFSFYAVNDELVKGYLVKAGVRIGVAGEGVVDGGRLITIKNPSYAVMRIPHEIKGCADGVMAKIENANVLVVSPPGGGKTTLLRDMARQTSKRYNTLIIDERYEIASVDGKGLPTLDVGDSEVVSGISKCIAYENCIRAMSPEIIVTDEIFSHREVESVGDIVRSGVRVFASVHGRSFEQISSSSVFSSLAKCFDVAITLEPTGKIIEVVNV